MHRYIFYHYVQSFDPDEPVTRCLSLRTSTKITVTTIS